MQDLENILGYDFKNKKLLKNALTHSSISNEKGEVSYERLEFLGDSVLNLIVSEYIYKNFPNLPEGKLTKLRASLVKEKTLMKFSNLLNVGGFLRLSYGEEKGGGRSRSSILADVFEAIVAAVYLDNGIEDARKIVLKFIVSELESNDEDNFRDYKTEIQEFVQSLDNLSLTYEIVDSKGPDHDKIFVIELKINEKTVSTGEAKSKKEAEQKAAKAALVVLSNSYKGFTSENQS
ncbi:MAG: ribonuclease III [Candidatus Improbicoccus pseudotrichonymphae]|uniref:Ribonuclease 3 n=1 Tax=Candidatus Improbicoccus pseudotrichonymphae TaxID=3033792 RepID=A0AA48IAE6_9FIRM|nr:MAG: ribonuclease III [Candidatus Improbicoccus pseudotrichonymphae]